MRSICRLLILYVKSAEAVNVSFIMRLINQSFCFLFYRMNGNDQRPANDDTDDDDDNLAALKRSGERMCTDVSY